MVSHFNMEIYFMPKTLTSISFNYGDSSRFFLSVIMMKHQPYSVWLDIKRAQENFKTLVYNANIYIPNLNTSDDKKGLNELIKNSLNVFFTPWTCLKDSTLLETQRNYVILWHSTLFLRWWMRLKNELLNYGVDLHIINCAL